MGGRPKEREGHVYKEVKEVRICKVRVKVLCVCVCVCSEVDAQCKYISYEYFKKSKYILIDYDYRNT